MTDEQTKKQWPSQTKEKVAERQKKHYWSHRDKRLAANKAWREANKEHRRIKRKEYAENEKRKRRAFRAANPLPPREITWTPEKKRAHEKAYYDAHTDKRLLKNKKWYAKNRQKALDQKKQYYIDNKDALIKKNNNYSKRRRKVDPVFRMICNLRNRLSVLLRTGKGGKRTLELIGCSRPELIHHLESQFITGMTWESYGKWHVDHKFPLCKVDVFDPEQVKAAMNYKNLQPLWASDNCSKSGKLIDGIELPTIPACIPAQPAPQSP